MDFTQGERIRLPGEDRFVVVDGAIPSGDGSWRLYVAEADGAVRPIVLSGEEAEKVEALTEDGTADSSAVLAGLWSEWMRRAAVSSKATALALYFSGQSPVCGTRSTSSTRSRTPTDGTGCGRR